MSDSETESLEAVEVPAPPKKSRPPVSDERRKQMLENLAKGRKTRAANLSNQRLDKEKAQVKKEQEHKCDHCGSQFKYKASKTKHMKTCKNNPDNDVEVEDKHLDLPPKEKENIVVERKEKEIEEPLKLKVEKKRRKKKVIYKEYSSSSDSSDEEIVVVQKKKSRRKGRVVYADGVNSPQPPPLQRQPVQPVAPPKPQITDAQKQAILQRRQQEQKYAEMGRKQEVESNRIKMLSANMLRKNRF